MITGLGMLVFYDPATGIPHAQIDHLVASDEDGKPLGLVDFESLELQDIDPKDYGIRTEITVKNGPSDPGTTLVIESGFWPDWLGGTVHDFLVETEVPAGKTRPRITALRHSISGYRRVRADIERLHQAAFDAIPAGQVIDLRSIKGSPSRPLQLDAQGRNAPTAMPVTRSLPSLPVTGVLRK